MQGPDGSVFTGGWQNDVKHGLGRKVYANGDVYEVSSPCHLHLFPGTKFKKSNVKCSIYVLTATWFVPRACGKAGPLDLEDIAGRMATSLTASGEMARCMARRAALQILPRAFALRWWLSAI